MKYFLFSFCFLRAILLSAQEINIIPKPKQLELKKGSFSITPATVIVLGGDAEKATASFFNQHLKTYYGFQLKTVKAATKNYIRFSTKRFILPGTEGKYDLTVNADNASVSGDTYSGTFYGMQTLLQLLPIENLKAANANHKLSIPQLSIQDEPRFQ